MIRWFSLFKFKTMQNRKEKYILYNNIHIMHYCKIITISEVIFLSTPLPAVTLKTLLNFFCFLLSWYQDYTLTV